MIDFARRLRFVDLPDGVRKQQGNAPALGGGIVVFVSTIAVCLLFHWAGALSLAKVGPGHATLNQVLVLVLGAFLILLLGIWDDAFGMRGYHKLLGQIAIVTILVRAGFGFESFDFYGVRFELGHLGFLVSAIWLLATINAFNLIDGADGVAATLGISTMLSLGVIMAHRNLPFAAIPIIVSATLCGFLVFNRPPARIYLGDGGSMLIGLLTGAVSIITSVKTEATFAVAAPLALMAIPFADTICAVFRRTLTGRSIYDTDRGHIHHQLLNRGLTPARLLSVIALVAGMTSLATICSYFLGFDLLLVFSVVLLCAGLIWFRILGYGELALLLSRGSSFLFGLRQRIESKPFESITQIQGDTDWEPLWEVIRDFAETHGFSGARLTLSIPWLHENLYAHWGNNACFRDRGTSKMEVPLKLEGRSVGWVGLAGGSREGMLTMGPLLNEFWDEIEAQLDAHATSSRRSVGVTSAAPDVIAMTSTNQV